MGRSRGDGAAACAACWRRFYHIRVDVLAEVAVDVIEHLHLVTPQARLLTKFLRMTARAAQHQHFGVHLRIASPCLRSGLSLAQSGLSFEAMTAACERPRISLKKCLNRAHVRLIRSLPISASPGERTVAEARWKETPVNPLHGIALVRDDDHCMTPESHDCTRALSAETARRSNGFAHLGRHQRARPDGQASIGRLATGRRDRPMQRSKPLPLEQTLMWVPAPGRPSPIRSMRHNSLGHLDLGWGWGGTPPMGASFLRYLP